VDTKATAQSRHPHTRLIVAVLNFVFMWACVATAAAPTNYYATAQGKRGEALRAALHAIIDSHTSVPYASSSFDTSDAPKVLDEDPTNRNNVILIYAQRSEPKSTFGQATGWNREHLWPNSFGLDDVEPAYSDLRNLRPEDVNVNSARGNKSYDISDEKSPSYGTAHAEASQCTSDSDSWEPPTNMKGDIARALFYMAVRYRGGKANEPALFLTDVKSQIGTTTNLMGQLSTLLRWHEEDPVDARELAREEIIYSRFQHNRNPFVDRPAWVRDAFWPELTIVRNGNEGTVSFSAEYNAMVLEHGFNSLNARWQTMGGSQFTNGITVFNSFLYPPNPETGYFRLRLP
jgi:endonuclease I